MSESAVENPESAVEIPESAAPPVAEIVTGEGAPPADGARAQIPEPEPEPLPTSPTAAPADLPPPLDVPDASGWRDLAAGKVKVRKKVRANSGGEEAGQQSPGGEGLEPASDGATRPQLTPAAAERVRLAKAQGYVQLGELALLYFARRWSVPEKEIAFSADEKQALSEAVAPLVSVDEDPWTTAIGVGLVVLGPRLQVLNAAAKAAKAGA